MHTNNRVPFLDVQHVVVLLEGLVVCGDQDAGHQVGSCEAPHREGEVRAEHGQRDDTGEQLGERLSALEALVGTQPGRPQLQQDAEHPTEHAAHVEAHLAAVLEVQNGERLFQVEAGWRKHHHTVTINAALLMQLSTCLHVLLGS